MILIALALSVSLFYRDFAKISFMGIPLLPLEFGTVCWWFWSALSQNRRSRPLRELWTHSLGYRVLSVFTGYAVCLGLIDAITLGDASLFRWAQHFGLAIYPLLWITTGYAWVRHVNAKYLNIWWMGILALNSAVFFLQFVGQAPIYTNLAAGPLGLIFLLWCLERPTSIQIRITAFCVALLPFVGMAVTHTKRISLLQLALTFVFYLWTRQRSIHWKRAKRAVGMTIVLLLIGIASASGLSSLSGKGNFFESIQHGEDRPIETFGNNLSQTPAVSDAFQGRFRRFIWETTLKDWAQSPATFLFGLRFIPEVPSYIDPEQKNDGHFDTARDPNYLLLDGKPVSGPHNSYLNGFARTGLLGGLLFLAALALLFRQILRSRIDSLTNLVLALVPIHGLVYGLFHNALESNYNCFLLWICLGILLGRKK